MTLELEDSSSDGRFYLSLHPTEQAVLNAASRLLAARISSGQYVAENAKGEIRWAVRMAIEMGNLIEINIRSENEM